jgi:hypothetical protein
MSTTATVANKKRPDNARIGKNNTSRTSGGRGAIKRRGSTAAWEPGLFTPPTRVSLGANQLVSDAAADSALKDRLIARRFKVYCIRLSHRFLQHSHCHLLRCDKRISHCIREPWRKLPAAMGFCKTSSHSHWLSFVESGSTQKREYDQDRASTRSPASLAWPTSAPRGSSGCLWQSRVRQCVLWSRR